MNEKKKTDDFTSIPPLASSLQRGSAWMIAMRWTIRLIGVISTLILARLLDPSDFGIVAMASIVVGIGDAVSGLGVDAALIQNTSAEKRDFDTAWTVRLVQGLVVGCLLVAAAPLAARYFGEPRVEVVIWLLAIGYIVMSAENIGVVAFRRDLDFARDFRFMVSKKVITFTITIGVALWLRSYWALVAGILAGNILGCGLGYLVHPYRPRFSLAGWSKLWSFSQWMLVRNIGSYAMSRSDELIVGGLAGTRPMGLYSVASEISQLPTSELVAPMDRALFPGFALLQQHRTRLRMAFLNVLQVVGVLTIPLGVGLGATAHNAVVVLLGAKWIEMVPIISILAIVGVVSGLRYTASTVLTAVAGAKPTALLTWAQLGIFVLLVWPLWRNAGLVGIALARLYASLMTAPLSFGMLIGHTTVRWLDLVRAIWRPVVSAGIMYATVRQLHDVLSGNPAIALVVEILTGAVTYIGILAILWRAAGRPDGAERLILTRVLQLVRGIRRDR